jgi:hypothetical protein
MPLAERLAGPSAALLARCCCTPCSAGNYRQAYECTNGAPTGMWIPVADIPEEQATAKVRYDDYGTSYCFYFADCQPSIPGGGTTFPNHSTYGVGALRGWFTGYNSCAACTCTFCYAGYGTPSVYPTKLTITVAQDAIDCCIDTSFGRRKVTGSASGTWEIPIGPGYTFIGGTVGAYGSLTVAGGPTVKDVTPDPSLGFPRPSAPVTGTDCATGFVGKDDTTCCDEGDLAGEDDQILIETFLDQRFDFDPNDGCFVQCSTVRGGCLLWSFAMPGCEIDDDEEDDLAWSADSGSLPDPSGPTCGAFTDCPVPSFATATGVMSWAA